MHFSHEQLDVYAAAREALVLGHRIASSLPRGYGHFADQLRRSLLSVHLGVAEAANRANADRSMRCRCTRAEAAESAAALDGLVILGLVDVERAEQVRVLLHRVYAMLTKLGKLGT
jgi:four helix bundle protein